MLDALRCLLPGGLCLGILGCPTGSGSSTSASPSTPCSSASGSYTVSYAAGSDDCGGVEALPADVYTIGPGGTLLDASGNAIGSAPPAGCVDSNISASGCVLSFDRDCTSGVLGANADVRASYRLDFAAHSGSVQISIGLNDDNQNELESCTASQTASIEAR
ncbi:MAG TPA: hypothetical protein VG963_09390 [Polyangiaceae bacterium]|nr:hypothetical protein [Polyangiaceae bacterium]